MVARPRKKAKSKTESGPSWKNTHERRRYLLSLFHSRGSLTRADLIKRLGVAPGTVTTDLKHLIAQGHIHRVRPSASSLRDYFELLTEKMLAVRVALNISWTPAQPYTLSAIVSYSHEEGA